MGITIKYAIEDARNLNHPLHTKENVKQLKRILQMIEERWKRMEITEEEYKKERKLVEDLIKIQRMDVEQEMSDSEEGERKEKGLASPALIFGRSGDDEDPQREKLKEILGPFFCEANNMELGELGQHFSFEMAVDTVSKLFSQKNAVEEISKLFDNINNPSSLSNVSLSGNPLTQKTFSTPFTQPFSREKVTELVETQEDGAIR